MNYKILLRVVLSMIYMAVVIVFKVCIVVSFLFNFFFCNGSNGPADGSVRVRSVLTKTYSKFVCNVFL